VKALALALAAGLVASFLPPLPLPPPTPMLLVRRGRDLLRRTAADLTDGKRVVVARLLSTSSGDNETIKRRRDTGSSTASKSGGEANARPAWPALARLVRLDRPAGTLLLLLPGAWALALAAPAGLPPDPGLAGTFALGALLMRSAGCAVNDAWDADLDRRVARTSSRPVAAGELSRGAAWATAVGLTGTAGFLCFGGLPPLPALPPTAWSICAASLPAIAAYPLAKRVVWAPQLVLAFTFNLPVAVGWAAAQPTWISATPAVDVATAAAGTLVGSALDALGGLLPESATAMASGGHWPPPVPWPPLPALPDILSTWAPAVALYAAGVAWTLLYDTIYAFQARRHREKREIPSSPSAPNCNPFPPSFPPAPAGSPGRRRGRGPVERSAAGETNRP